MSRRIDIELTSVLDDGSFTWRAAGARQPKGTIPGSLVPDASVGQELKVEIEQELDGIVVLGVVSGRAKAEKDNVLELISDDRNFQPVVETRAKRDRGDRRGGRGRRDGDNRRGRDGDDRKNRRDRRDGGGGRGRDGDDRGGRDGGDGRNRRNRGDGRRQRGGPSFTPPPEVPQRPKPKRLKPGKQHRQEVLDKVPAEQRPVAELALQGMNAVRQRVREENQRAVADGRPEMPEATVLKMAEEILPTLRVAEWRDRAEAAIRQLDHLDLRDLRSVVATAGDPIVARDETTKELADQLREALVRKQDQELQLWFGDVDAALAVGRVIRALRLSSQPPKAGVPFPADIAQRLIDSTTASLAPMDSPERWAAMLEALAFSPIRSHVNPTRKPDVVNDELLAVVKRLAPALPQIAALFEIEVDPKAPMPKPQRPGPRQKKGRDGQGQGQGQGKGQGDRRRKDGGGRDGDRGGGAGRDGGRDEGRKQRPGGDRSKADRAGKQRQAAPDDAAGRTAAEPAAPEATKPGPTLDPQTDAPETSGSEPAPVAADDSESAAATDAPEMPAGSHEIATTATTPVDDATADEPIVSGDAEPTAEPAPVTASGAVTAETADATDATDATDAAGDEPAVTAEVLEANPTAEVTPESAGHEITGSGKAGDAAASDATRDA